MLRKEISVKSATGLQSKYAAMFIQKASAFKSDIWVEKDQRRANAKSLLGVLSLSVGSGMTVFITADGTDEEAAINELEKFLCLGNGGEA